MFEVVSILLAAVITGCIAFPQLFYGLKKESKKQAGSSYWGVYGDSPTEDLQGHKVDMPKPGRKLHVVAGSQMYAGGHGRR